MGNSNPRPQTNNKKPSNVHTHLYVRIPRLSIRSPQLLVINHERWPLSLYRNTSLEHSLVAQSRNTRGYTKKRDVYTRSIISWWDTKRFWRNHFVYLNHFATKTKKNNCKNTVWTPNVCFNWKQTEMWNNVRSLVDRSKRSDNLKRARKKTLEIHQVIQ